MRGPYPWSYSTGRKVYDLLELSEAPRSWIEVDLMVIEDITLRTNYRYFFIALEGYRRSSNPVMSTFEIYSKSTMLGPKYADELKRVRQCAFYKKINAKFLGDPDVSPEEISSAYDIKDIGDIFNYAYLPHWATPPEEVDDYKYYTVPLPEYDLELLDAFEDELFSLLPPRAKIQKVHLDEILLEMSSSSTLKADRKRGSVWREKLGASNRLVVNSTFQPCERILIDAGPGNVRDTVLTDINSLHRIQLIERQTLEVNRLIKGLSFIGKQEEFQKELSKFQRSSNYFLNLDKKKDGIQKPRVLLERALRALKRAYPDLSAYDCPGFYNTFYPFNIEEECVRGHGLGMANQLSSLIYLTIHHMAIKGCYTEDAINMQDRDIQVLILNDDYIGGCQSEDDVVQFANQLCDLSEELGLILNDKKTFFSGSGFVFCEEYRKDFDETFGKKESYRNFFLLAHYGAINIVHAKVICNGAYPSTWADLPGYIHEIQGYWGFEFHRDESKYPAPLGGWYSEGLFGIDVSYVNMDIDQPEWVNRAAYACSQTYYIRRKDREPKGKVEPPARKIFGSHLIISDGMKNILNDLPSKILYDKFEGRMTSNQLIDYYRGLALKRSKAYLSPIRNRVRHWFDQVLHDSECDVLYPKDVVTHHRVRPFVFEGSLRDPFESSNPILSGILYDNPSIDYTCFKDIVPIKGGNHITSMKRTSQQRRQALHRIEVFNLKSWWPENDDYYLYEFFSWKEEDSVYKDLCGYYRQPINAYKAMQVLSGDPYTVELPTYEKRVSHPERENLTFYEFLLCSIYPEYRRDYFFKDPRFKQIKDLEAFNEVRKIFDEDSLAKARTRRASPVRDQPNESDTDEYLSDEDEMFDPDDLLAFLRMREKQRSFKEEEDPAQEDAGVPSDNNSEPESQAEIPDTSEMYRPLTEEELWSWWGIFKGEESEGIESSLPRPEYLSFFKDLSLQLARVSLFTLDSCGARDEDVLQAICGEVRMDIRNHRYYEEDYENFVEALISFVLQPAASVFDDEDGIGMDLFGGD